MNTIRKLRLERNLKQSDLAQILNVKQNTISNWETERTEVDRVNTKKPPDKEVRRLMGEMINVV